MNAATKLMVAKLTEMAGRGLSYKDAAEEAGISYFLVCSYNRRYAIGFKLQKRGRKLLTRKDARSADMRLMYEEGKTLAEIGQKYGITRERVRQLMTRDYGIRAKDGGQAELARRTRREFHKKREARYQKKWGCSFKQYWKILKHPGKPTYAFVRQRTNARNRGIGWELNLIQWWKVWEQSGNWAARGRGRGYCMCRLNDTGPYAVDNVYIATGPENMQDYWANRRGASAIMEAAQ